MAKKKSKRSKRADYGKFMAECREVAKHIQANIDQYPAWKRTADKVLKQG